MLRTRWTVIALVAAFGIATLLVLPDRRPITTPKDCVPKPQERQRLGVTPIPYAEIIDLSPDVPERDKSQIIVFRCDGRFALYKVLGASALVYPELGPGDVIFNSFPAESLVGQQIHVTTPVVVTVVVTATPRPPVTPFPTDTPRSYPPAPPEPTATPWDYPAATLTARAKPRP
jgi:hypothetical protein